MPAALLRHVEEHAALLGGDALERELELLAAVAAERVEDVAGQALRVHADEDVLLAVHIALHEGDVRACRSSVSRKATAVKSP